LRKTLFRSSLVWIALSCLVTGSIAIAVIQRPRSVTQKNQVGGGRVVLGKNDDLQAAINRALPGDTLVLEAGAVFTGPFILPRKSGDTYITIQTSRAEELKENVRVTAAQAPLFARLQNAIGEPAVKTESGAHHYKFIGIEFSPSQSQPAVGDIVRFGDGKNQASLADVPHHLVLDRCYIHGFPEQEVRRGVSLNSGETEISNSLISDIHGRGYDTQAICGWNGPGPFRIINNSLQASGENLMFGGADPAITGLVPSDIEIRQNYFFKPLSWKVGDPEYKGIHWSVKNLLELKSARRVVIDGNYFENCWVDAQTGYAIQFTVRNQDGAAPWSVIEEVEFTNNVVKNAGAGINLLGSDNIHPSKRANKLSISNNFFQAISGVFVQISGYPNVMLRHNSHFQTGNILSFYGEASPGFVYCDNLTIRDERGYGIKGDASGEGTVALDNFAPQYRVSQNVIVGANKAQYPAQNFFPSSPAQVGFRNWAAADFRLTANSPFRNAASDRSDPGANFAALQPAENAKR
jgi:hypothetical protein